MASCKVVFLASMVSIAAAALSGECPPPYFHTQGNLDLKWFTSSKWYIHQQMVINFHPADHFYCNTAEFGLREKTTLLGYDMKVTYNAENAAGKPLGPLIPKTLCAKWKTGEAVIEGKAVIAPCFVPSMWAGDYWVVAFGKDEDWALVSGGAPNLKGTDGCKTNSLDGGLWIFTRDQHRNESLVQKVRGVAKDQGFDLSVLLDTNHTSCASLSTVTV
jgi:hypothetical protein